MSTETFTNTPRGWAELCRKFAIRDLNADKAIQSAEYSVAGRELLALQAALDANDFNIEASTLDSIRLLTQPAVDGVPGLSLMDLVREVHRMAGGE